MKQSAIFFIIAFATACADSANEDLPTADTGSQASPDAGADTGTDTGEDAGPPECAPETEVAFDTGCSDQGLRFIFSRNAQNSVSVRSNPYPEAIGADQGTPRERTVTDQCYVLDFVGAEPGTPSGLPCFDAGALTLTSGSTSVEIPRTSEECYNGIETLPDEEVNVAFGGGSDIEAASFDIELPAHLDIQVVEDADGAQVTLLNPRDEEAPSWRLYWFGAGDSLDVVCEPVDDRISFRRADLDAIDELGQYGNPQAYRFDNTGEYLGDGKGVIVNMATHVRLNWRPWR